VETSQKRKRVTAVAEKTKAVNEERSVKASFPDEKFRYLLRFTKNGPLRFIGHLDLLRVFQLTMRRAALPVAYSQGFNPHQLISFALPLPLGMAGENDYAEIYFTEVIADCDEIITRFNNAAPSGLRLTLLKKFPDGPGVAACCCAADYVYSADVPQQVIDDVLTRNELIIPKKTKSGVKDTDIRPDILTLKTDGETVRMRLSAGSQRFLNPLTVAGLLIAKAEATPDAGLFTRTELYRLNPDGTLVPLSVVPGDRSIPACGFDANSPLSDYE
jgi:radical SAM-linked protein